VEAREQAPPDPSPHASRPATAGPGGWHVEAVCARRTERLLMRVRYVVAPLVLGMSLIFEPASRAAGGAIAVALLAVNVHGHLRLPGLRTREAAARHARVGVLVDALAAAVAFALFLPDPAAMPVALVVFLAFELALRWGARGAAVGAGSVAVALAVRVWAQASVLEGGAVRPELVLLWAAIAALMLAVGLELRARDARWMGAVEARERIADDLMATVVHTLEHAGIEREATTYADVLAAVHEILEGDGERREQLIERVASVLATPHQGLSPREQEILLLLARGHNDARIAAALFISPSTVRNHVRNMRTKLDLASRDELRAFARRYAPPA
jgi:DNA-binding CsgD family transcriptional regulator